MRGEHLGKDKQIRSQGDINCASSDSNYGSRVYYTPFSFSRLWVRY